jgi:hypothetical protein
MIVSPRLSRRTKSRSRVPKRPRRSADCGAPDLVRRRRVVGARQFLSSGTFVREGRRALSMDERNAILAAQSRARPVREVLAESEHVFAPLLVVVAGCPDATLNDPRRLGLPDDVVPWTLVANNSYAHYQEHALAIRRVYA